MLVLIDKGNHNLSYTDCHNSKWIMHIYTSLSLQVLPLLLPYYLLCTPTSWTSCSCCCSTASSFSWARLNWASPDSLSAITSMSERDWIPNFLHLSHSNVNLNCTFLCKYYLPVAVSIVVVAKEHFHTLLRQWEFIDWHLLQIVLNQIQLQRNSWKHEKQIACFIYTDATFQLSNEHELECMPGIYISRD